MKRVNNLPNNTVCIIVLFLSVNVQIWDTNNPKHTLAGRGWEVLLPLFSLLQKQETCFFQLRQ